MTKKIYRVLAFLMVSLFSLHICKAQIGPSCVISSPDGLLSTRPDSIPFKVTFSKVVTGFMGTDPFVFNGHVIGITPTTPDSVYIAYVRADSCGMVTMRIFAGAAQDSAGNQSLAVNDYTLRYDTCVPNPAFIPHYGNPTGSNPIPLDIYFREPVTGFTLTDILLVNGSISGSMSNYNNKDSLFTIQIIPTGPGLTIITISIDSGAIRDKAMFTNDSSYYTLVYNPVFASFTRYEDDPEVKIFPNPSQGIFLISDPESTLQTWEAYDAQGKSLISGTINQSQSIDLSTLSSGIYWLHLKGDKRLISRKVQVFN